MDHKSAMVITGDGITVTSEIDVESLITAVVAVMQTILRPEKLVRPDAVPMFCYTKGSIKSNGKI